MSGLEALLTGRVLAERYRIEAVIGRGGMGAVYRAMDERLGRQVAVKIITLSGAADPQTRERLQQRFLREARAAAALPHHPNVVPVYDFGTDPALGLDFLVMELLRGEDLASHFTRSGPPPLPMAIHILHEASRGVAVGHRSGLVHRDVKPGNIFLVQDSHGEMQVRVLDFGIAKLTDDDTLSALTQDGRTPLSPSFASPEQLRGLSRITPASDVFSLGAVGYQLLTGERPFSEVDRNRMSLGMPVPVPSLRQRNPAIPPALDEVVRRALSFDAEARFPDAGTFASVLDQTRREMGNQPLPPYDPRIVAAAPPPRQPDAPAYDDRTEFLDDRTLLDPDSAAAAAAPAPPVRQAPVHQQAPPRQPPLPPRRREPESSGMGTFLMALVVILLFGAGGVFAWWMITEQDRVAVVDTPPPPEEVPPILPEEEAPAEPAPLALEAAIANQEGLRLYRAGDYAGAHGHFQRAVQLAPDSASYRYNLGLALLRDDAVRPAMREFERVIRQDPERAAAHFYLGEAHLELGDTASAIAAMETARQYTTDARERTITDRRLSEIRAAVLQPPQPAPAPPPGPEVDMPPGADARRGAHLPVLAWQYPSGTGHSPHPESGRHRAAREIRRSHSG
jgi:serine/threonine protein kinase